MQNLPGKTAFVTGGASGIGLGIAKALLGAGMNVVIADIRDDHLAAAHGRTRRRPSASLRSSSTSPTGPTTRARRTRPRRASARSTSSATTPASRSSVRPMLATFADWDWVMGVNLGGTINGIVTILPRIKQHGEGGHIVNTASMSGSHAASGRDHLRHFQGRRRCT